MNQRRLHRSPFSCGWLRSGAALRVAMFAIAIASGFAQAAPQRDGWQPAEILPRQGHAMAFDSKRNVTILFGGDTLISTGPNGLNGETWELSGAPGSDWVRRAIVGPSPRSGAAMCFDDARDVIVLFGGFTAAGPSSETWEYDGETWTLRTSGGPTSRASAGMVFDAARNVCVIYGGSGATGGPLDDTWEWDGRGWTFRSGVGGPGGRVRHAMAFDSAREVTVLFGGASASSFYTSQTWEYDGQQWLLRDDASGIGGYGVAMAFDEVNQRCVRWGGDPFGAIAAWNGTQWTGVNISFPDAPPGVFLSTRISAAMAYDTTRSLLVFVGGFDGNTAVWGDTWEWSGDGPATWRNPSVHGVENTKTTVYDSARHVLAVYKNNEMWEYDGATRTWARRPAGGLAARNNAVMVYDSTRQVYVLFGGRVGPGAGTSTNETWEWNATTGVWTFKSNSGPSPRFAHAMAFDSTRNVTVLFGGRNDVGTYFNGTWEWNGASWNPRSELGPARAFHDMAFDPVRSRTVLFGGQTAGVSALNDVWEWNGISGQWEQAAAANPPPPRLQHRMVYDSTNGQFIMFGGSNSTNGFLGDAWSYDAAAQAWSPIDAVAGPVNRSFHSMAFDSDRARAVVLGGFTDFGMALDHWELCVAAACPADISPPGGNGSVDVNDLLTVVTAWGPCPAPPANCAGDIAPPGGNGQVDVNDLLLVITTWGTCP